MAKNRGRRVSEVRFQLGALGDDELSQDYERVKDSTPSEFPLSSPMLHSSLKHLPEDLIGRASLGRPTPGSRLGSRRASEVSTVAAGSRLGSRRASEVSIGAAGSRLGSRRASEVSTVAAWSEISTADDAISEGGCTSPSLADLCRPDDFEASIDGDLLQQKQVKVAGLFAYASAEYLPNGDSSFAYKVGRASNDLASRGDHKSDSISAARVTDDLQSLINSMNAGSCHKDLKDMRSVVHHVAQDGESAAMFANFVGSSDSCSRPSRALRAMRRKPGAGEHAIVAHVEAELDTFKFGIAQRVQRHKDLVEGEETHHEHPLDDALRCHEYVHSLFPDAECADTTVEAPTLAEVDDISVKLQAHMNGLYTQARNRVVDDEKVSGADPLRCPLFTSRLLPDELL